MGWWIVFFFFSSRRRHTRLTCDWSSDVCSSDLEPLVPGAIKVPNTNPYRPPPIDPAEAIALAIELEGPETVAAVFLEPVQNSGGCFPPPPGYFQRVREIC